MSFLIKKPFGRRDLLRGMLQGAAVSVTLPFLDCFLNENGTALAATGAPLPVRFGTWFWSMGHTPGHTITSNPNQIEFLEECRPLIRHLEHLNFFSQFNSPLDGRPNHVHQTGWVTVRTANAPVRPGDIAIPTLDVLVADHIGSGSRFRSLDVSCTGNPRDTFSGRSTFSRNAAEVSPLDLYTRVFGADFADPNSSEDFRPDPDLLLQQSVLSGIAEQRKAFERRVGAADRVRLDEYFSSIRQLETQLSVLQQPPPPADACDVGVEPDASAVGVELPVSKANHDAFASILAMALACNQTKVFNVAFNNALSNLRKPGTAYTHHTLTHEEPVDQLLGYQPEAFWFNCRVMESLADFVDVFANVREGAGTLLDNTLIFAHSETSYAKVHAVDNLPVMTIGKAGGRIKTGRHIIGNGDPVSRIGLTAMQLMGVPIDQWGTGSLRASRPISDIVV